MAKDRAWYETVWNEVTDFVDDVVEDVTDLFGGAGDETPIDQADVSLSSGTYRLYFRGIDDPTAILREPEEFHSTIDGVFKTGTIISISFDFEMNQCLVEITLKENPWPLLVVKGIVIAAVAVIGAITVNAVLTKVEKLLDNKTVKSGLWIVALAVAAPLLVTFFGRKR